MTAMPFADVNGQKLRYEDTGGDGPAILFSHGYLMDHTMFEPQVEALRDRCRVITWDERGFGDTEESADPFTYWDSAADALGLLSHLGIEKAVLAGMSQGGFLSLRAALTAPERVLGLVLIDTQTGQEDPEKIEGYNQLIAAWSAPGGPPQEVLDIIAGIILGDEFPDTAAWQAKWRQIPAERMQHSFTTLVGRDDIGDRVGELTVPILIVHGDDDAAIPVDKARDLSAKLPGSDYLELPGGTHAGNLTHPDETNAAIGRLLDRL
jgi:pimeloyl-ACP methyl ester carboxylesterase